MDERLAPLGSRAENARKVIRALYKRPLIDAGRIAGVTGLSASSAYRLRRRRLQVTHRWVTVERR